MESISSSPGISTPVPPGHSPHVIPAWLVPFLALPIRRWVDDPARSVLPQIRPGMRILEVGPGSGFFTVPMAVATGPGGFLACVELQEPVRRRLEAKLERKGLSWVKVRPCSERDLQVTDLEGSMDLVVSIDVLHEMPEPDQAIRWMYRSLCPGGRLLVMEPRNHCPKALFSLEKTWAEEAGFLRLPDPLGLGSRRLVAFFQRPSTEG